MRTDVIEGTRVLNKVPTYMANSRVDKNSKICEFDSLSQFKKFMIKHKDFDKCSSLSSMKESEWSGSYTYDDFLTILDNGDEEIMKLMKTATDKKVAELSKKYEEVINGYKFDVTGQFFDVGLVLTGVPETWLEPELEEEEKVQVEIIIDGAFSAGVNKDIIIKSSSRILAITKILEDHDVEVKIRIVSGNSGHNGKKRGDKIFVSTLVKDFDEPINYKKMSALMSPTYHRRATFKIIELDAKHNVSWGYGSPYHTSGFIQLNDYRAIDALEERLFNK